METDTTPITNGSTTTDAHDSSANNKDLKSILSNSDKLEVKDIINAVKNTLMDLMTLEITTWVPESNIQADNSQNTSQEGQPGNRIRTVINLIDGDISNEIGSQFVGNGPYTELREFHLTQVQEGKEIIQKNLETVEKLYKILVELYKSSKNSGQSLN